MRKCEKCENAKNAKHVTNATNKTNARMRQTRHCSRFRILRIFSFFVFVFICSHDSQFLHTGLPCTLTFSAPDCRSPVIHTHFQHTYTLISDPNTLSCSTPIHRHFNTNTLSFSMPMPARLHNKYIHIFNTSTRAHPGNQYLLILNTNTWSCSTLTRSHVQHKYVCWKRDQRCSEQRSICVLKSNPLSLCWTSVYRCLLYKSPSPRD